jgi:hypothetical protein
MNKLSPFLSGVKLLFYVNFNKVNYLQIQNNESSNIIFDNTKIKRLVWLLFVTLSIKINTNNN